MFRYYVNISIAPLLAALWLTFTIYTNAFAHNDKLDQAYILCNQHMKFMGIHQTWDNPYYVRYCPTIIAKWNTRAEMENQAQENNDRGLLEEEGR